MYGSFVQVLSTCFRLFQFAPLRRSLMLTFVPHPVHPVEILALALLLLFFLAVLFPDDWKLARFPAPPSPPTA